VSQSFDFPSGDRAGDESLDCHLAGGCGGTQGFACLENGQLALH